MSKLDNLSDRDLLIQNATNVENLCSQFEELKKDNKTEHETLFKLLDGQANSKVSNKLFFFIIGFIILSIVTLTGYVGSLSNDVTKNSTCIERIERPIGGM
jgi:hypothetical protein